MKGEVLLSSNSLLTADNVPVKSITHLNKATAEISIFPQNLFPRAHSLLFKISSSQMKTKFVISKPGFPNKKHSTWNTKKKVTVFPASTLKKIIPMSNEIQRWLHSFISCVQLAAATSLTRQSPIWRLHLPQKQIPALATQFVFWGWLCLFVPSATRSSWW